MLVAKAIFRVKSESPLFCNSGVFLCVLFCNSGVFLCVCFPLEILNRVGQCIKPMLHRTGLVKWMERPVKSVVVRFLYVYHLEYPFDVR